MSGYASSHPVPHTCMGTRARVHTYVHTCTCTKNATLHAHCMHAHTRAHRSVHMDICTHNVRAHKCTHTHINMSSHTCTHTCTNICMHTGTHVHTEFTVAGGFNQHHLSPSSLQRAPHRSPCVCPGCLPRPVFHSPSSAQRPSNLSEPESITPQSCRSLLQVPISLGGKGSCCLVL